MAEEKNKVIREGRIEMNYLTGEAETRRLQELKEKWESDWNSSMSYFNQKGLERGLECAKKKQVKIIRNLLELGMDIETIAKVTEQTLEEVKNIKSKYNL